MGAAMTSIPVMGLARPQSPALLRRPWRLALALAGALGLSACEEDSVIRQGIDSLGSGFVEAFEQGPNDTPVDASEVELTLTPGIEPFDP